MAAIKIWHDNSANTANESSWYLKHVIIHDLQTREKSYFINEKWLAIDKGDLAIERTLSISSEVEKTSFKYLLGKSTKEKLRDGHLWFSIFARPLQSSFTRLDRLTCCFVLLAISMLMNIMYYGMDTSAAAAAAQQDTGLKLGPYINITAQQIAIGIITNLIVFPPTLLLVQLFRRIRRRETRLLRIKKILNKDNASIQKRKLFEAKFPWWFKIIAYAISFVFASVSLLFVVVKGIEFGDEKVTKWLTSLIISFLSSILFTQPIQVI